MVPTRHYCAHTSPDVRIAPIDVATATEAFFFSATDIEVAVGGECRSNGAARLGSARLGFEATVGQVIRVARPVSSTTSHMRAQT